jgi:hypothetical protein
MTQAELVAQLRDIHLPADASAAAAGWAWWPIITLALALGVVLLAGYWRRTAWRRQARAWLESIETERDLERRWSSLVMLAAQVARRAGRPEIVPPSAYRRPQAVTREDIEALGAHLRQAIAR